jgi:hypothetical protein
MNHYTPDQPHAWQIRAHRLNMKSLASLYRAALYLARNDQNKSSSEKLYVKAGRYLEAAMIERDKGKALS